MNEIANDKERNMARKVKIINLGCKLNQFEGLGILQKLITSGYTESKNGKDEPDIFIVNTCTVTRKSDRKSRHAIYSSIKEKKPEAIVIVTGCMAQTNREELEKIKGVDLVVENDLKAVIPDIIKVIDEHRRERYPGEIFSDYRSSIDSGNRTNPFDFALPFTSSRSRAFLKVQDGCDLRCAYCKVPLARGRSISRPVDDVVEALRKLLEGGYSEVVLTGVNLGAYNFEDVNLAGLLERCLRIPGKWRLRLSSIEPLFIDDFLIDVLGEDKIVPHFHIPLQSGSDSILKKMNRGYNSEQFIKIIDKIKKIKSDVHLATDIIVGFPSENESDFIETVNVVENVGFASLHVFKYSPREGTAAERLKDTVPEIEKKRRSEYLIKKSKEQNYIFRRRYLDKIREGIIERHRSDIIALTDNYIKVIVNGNQSTAESLFGKPASIRIKRVDYSATYGEIVGV